MIVMNPNLNNSKILLGSSARVIQTLTSIQRLRKIGYKEKDVALFREITILPGLELELAVEVNSIQILLPLVGTVKLTSGQELQVEEIMVQFLPKGKTLTLTNSFQEETIHLIWIQIPENRFFPDRLHHFSLDDNPNHIQKVVSIPYLDKYQPGITLYLGKLEGRTDAVLSSNFSSFGFVISGAFEYQNCLLEQGDALWVESKKTLEMEALSKEAVILIIEFGNQDREAIDFS